MCRWFAYISDSEPCLLDDILNRPDNSIVKQVQAHYLPHLFPHGTAEDDKKQEAESAARNLYFNKLVFSCPIPPSVIHKLTGLKKNSRSSDGTGVCFFNRTLQDYGEAKCRMPQIYKTILAPTNDVNFRSLCKNTSSRTVFAHVRMATSEVQQFNSHPFDFGRHVFMHNGSVANFSRIRLDLCAKMSPKAYANIKGSTDSEHIAALYMTHLGDDWTRQYPLDEMKRALERAIADIISLQKKLPDATTPVAASSLNLCTTDGEELLAFRFRNTETGQPPSLYFSTTAGVLLNRKYPGHPNFQKWEDIGDSATGLLGADELRPEAFGNHVIVASEPTTKSEDDWALVPKNKAVLVDFPRGENRIRIEDIIIPP
ncbi:unnamed protein product [Rhizoctonia solani]|uniref:Glutamine amidotransferase type-2 domain-containing protein n=1 Tax=Rhizoctonia solani TaxID=456999 RepID=A0A8H3DJ27_9AGAM|nr:unnamed protein product [Rhizoctonia solani]